MYYKRNLPKRRMRDYFMPFFIIILIVAIIIVGWRTLNKVFIGGGTNMNNERVLLSIENGSATAMMAEKTEWEAVHNGIYLYKGEKIKTGSDGRITLAFFEQSILRLDNNSQVEFTQMKQDSSQNDIGVSLVEGQVWAKIERITNPDSKFVISTDTMDVSSKGGVIVVQYPGTVYVVEGDAQVDIKSNDEIIKTVNVGVGQEFIVDPDKINDLNDGLDATLLYAIEDTFKSSSWYLFNMKKDGSISAFEEPGTVTDENTVDGTKDEVTTDETTGDSTTEETTTETTLAGDETVSISSPAAKSYTNKSSVTVSGILDPAKVSAIYIDGKAASISGSSWKASGVTLDTEGLNKLTVEAEDATGNKMSLPSLEIYYDTTPPSAPQFNDPGKNDETVEIDDVEQIIKGSVSDDAYAVVVNDYKLGKYVPGSGEFAYYAKVSYGNLEVGDNEYKAYAEDKAGNKSDEVKITLTLKQETLDAAKTESTSEESLPSSSSSGGVKITSPNGGVSLTTAETAFDITGEVPVTTVKVMVNDYQLTKFTEGNTTFTYKASSAMGNLEIGKKNTYTAEAYDKDDKLIGSASIVIDVQSGSAAAPVITMPSTSATYTTTLADIVVGGTIGKWIQKVYLNDELLASYIPGSEKWSKSVTLAAGENTFTVYGEQDSEKTGTATITITYQP
jgi:hypothetical protein